MMWRVAVAFGVGVALGMWLEAAAVRAAADAAWQHVVRVLGTT